MSELDRITSIDNVNEIVKEKEKISKEESAEECIIQKELFVKIKKWYNSNDKIKEQYIHML